jgi:signal peptidase II
VRAGVYARAGLVLAVVVVLDQVTKALVRDGIAIGEEDSVLPAVTLVHVRNSGVAFGAFAGGGALVIALVAAALTALLFYFVTHLDRPLVWLPTGLLLGGAAGNLIDRVRAGAVTDFIKLPHWPAFNVADMCITFGVLSLIYVLERVR